MSHKNQTSERREGLIAPYAGIKALDPGNPLHRAIFEETLRDFYPRNPAYVDSVLQAMDDHRGELFTNPLLKAGAPQSGLTWAKAMRLVPMYLQFALVFLIVFMLSYYGTQTLGVYRFIRSRRDAAALPVDTQRGSAGTRMLRLSRVFLTALMGIVLFAPAYVIAYSLKTTVDTDSVLFMIVLGVLSNGVLITYTTKFTTFLVHESRRGYVETALVKGLADSYAWNPARGFSRRSVLRLRKSFQGHVLHHIFTNARFQYIPTLKEQASFLITGLVIIEMALNIHGHLCYELMQNVLRKDFEVVGVILVAIFLLVKLTDIVIDAWYEREVHRYDNRGGEHP